MEEFRTLLGDGNFMSFFIFIIIFAIPLSAIALHYWSLMARTKADAELKRLMIEQGRSVEEMERILALQSSEPSKNCRGKAKAPAA